MNAAAILTFTFLAFTAVYSTQAEDMRLISVSGEGKAMSPPDMAVVHTGVVTQADDAATALAENNAAVEKVMKVLESNKVAKRDIQTSNFNVQPEYERGPRGRSEPKIVGYRVTNQVQVRVRNLATLGAILDALVRAGSNQISGVAFGIDSPDDLLNQARNRAVADATARAQLYARAAGVEVGPVISISEQPPQMPRPQMMGRAGVELAMAASDVPVATGEQEVRATVHMQFEIIGR